VIEGPIRSKPF
jgi:hypothetical protein